jgi:MYXO-CTERM domain-containing protein
MAGSGGAENGERRALAAALALAAASAKRRREI